MSWSKLNEFVLPLGLIGCLLVFFVPLPGGMMDMLLAGNIAIGLIVLLTTLYVRSPLEFSVFPTVLLATTLARLVLNVATTRLILTKADTLGLSAAGEVVRQFGQYVSGDRLVVGFVIFAIIFVIQMMVITRGATRISEVAARFSLDGIPGRQMAIDADLAAGVIDQQEAQRRRDQLNRQADFYGAMDGASKFVRGDAVAGVIITLINIVGGFSIGVVQGSMGILEVADVYTKLTIGDGLVSQIPALLISLAAGLLVTRGSSSVNLPAEFLRQMFSRPEVLAVAGAFLILLIFAKLPAIPLLLLAAACLALAWYSRDAVLKPEETAPAAKPSPAANGNAPRRQKGASAPRQSASRLEDFLQIDVLELELGRGVVGIANASRGGDLLARIKTTRERIAGDLGLILPSVRVRDNVSLDDDQYSLKLLGNVVATGKIPLTGVVCVPPDRSRSRIFTAAASFSHPTVPPGAKLISTDRVAEVRAAGGRIVSASQLVAGHLQSIVHEFGHELLTRDATRKLIDEVKRNSPTVVDELIPDVLRLSEVQQVLRNLLREGVPIRQLPLILEALGDYAPENRDTAALTELVRKRLARTISARYRDNAGLLHVVTLDPQLEDLLSNAATGDVFSASEKLTFQEMLRKTMERLVAENRPPILLTKSDLRLAVLRLARAVVPGVVVIGQDEVAQGSQVRSVGIVGLV